MMTLTPRTRQRYAPSVTGPRPAQKRVTRVVYGVYVLVVAAFVVSNIVQVAGALFGKDSSGTARVPATPVKSECAELLRLQAVDVDRARLLASEQPNAEAARFSYAEARKKAREHTGELASACADDPRGADALAALARLDRAAESHAVRTSAELSPVRLAAHSFISGDPQ